MKRLFQAIGISLGLLPLLLLTTGGLVSAHVLKEDNGISGVLHIPPEDNPEAGQPTELDESFGDAQNTFSLQDCSCKVVVTMNNQTIQTTIPTPALSGASLESVAIINFPAVGVYNVIFEGSAKDGKFHTFNLNYLVRVPTVVGGTTQVSGQGQEVLVIGLGNLAILIMVGVAMVRGGGRYARKPSIKSSGKP